MKHTPGKRYEIATRYPPSGIIKSDGYSLGLFFMEYTRPFINESISSLIINGIEAYFDVFDCSFSFRSAYGQKIKNIRKGNFSFLLLFFHCLLHLLEALHQFCLVFWLGLEHLYCHFSFLF